MKNLQKDTDTLVLNRLEDMLLRYHEGSFSIRNNKPQWMAWVDYDRENINIERPRTFDVLQLFPVLGSFLPYAKDLWKKPDQKTLHSDAWRQDLQNAQEEIYLQASAINIFHEHFLIIRKINCVGFDSKYKKLHMINTSEEEEQRLRDLADRANEASKTKSAFLANMSHELRTPLNSIIGFSNLLLKDKNISPNSQEFIFLEKIKSNGIHLLSVINDVLDLSKIEAKKMDLDLGEVEIHELLQETVQEMEGLRSTKNVQIDIDVPKDLKPIHTDRKKLKQILLNLISNAYKFAEGKAVTVKVDVRESVPIRILVIDTGIGIAKEKLESIFDSFEQGDNSNTRRFEGTGLGLTISKSLCELLGYDITVSSTEKKGSTFVIHIRS